MAGIDPNIALSYKFPQIEGPLQGQSRLLQLQQMMQQQQMGRMQMEEARRKQGMQQQYQSAMQKLGPTASHEDLLGVALNSGMVPPKDMASLLQGEANKKAQIAANREATMARLTQAWQTFQSNRRMKELELDQKERQGADRNQIAQERMHLQQAAEAFHQRLQIEAAQRADAGAKYNFGYTPGTQPQPTVQAPAPQSGNYPGVTVTAMDGESDTDLMKRYQALRGAGQPQASSFAPQAPAAEPQPQLIQPGPSDLDVRDLRARATPSTPVKDRPKPPGYDAWPQKVKDQYDASISKQQGTLNINLAGGRESVFINRVVMSGNQAAADLENVVKLPLSASRGIFGGRQQGKSLFEAGKETLANTMTTQEVQSYNVMATGFQRALAAIEGAGLAPTNALMHQMDAVIFKEGDTNLTKLQKLAQTRQIVEKGLETITANERVPAETKKHANDIVNRIKKAVPFTMSDLFALQAVQETNPNATLGDVMKAPGKWSEDKEQRYQELLRKRGGS